MSKLTVAQEVIEQKIDLIFFKIPIWKLKERPVYQILSFL
jgi:hypothetical protein